MSNFYNKSNDTNCQCILLNNSQLSSSYSDYHPYPYDQINNPLYNTIQYPSTSQISTPVIYKINQNLPSTDSYTNSTSEHLISPNLYPNSYTNINPLQHQIINPSFHYIDPTFNSYLSHSYSNSNFSVSNPYTPTFDEIFDNSTSSLSPSPSCLSISSQSTSYTSSSSISSINSHEFQPISPQNFDNTNDVNSELSSIFSEDEELNEDNYIKQDESVAYFPLSSNRKDINIGEDSNKIKQKNASIHFSNPSSVAYSSSNSSSRIVRKAYKSSYVPVSPFPKIIKRDFRRYFPQMFANVFNSGDIDLFSSFIYQFFTPTFQLYKVCGPCLSPKDNPRQLTSFNLNRAQYILFFFFHTLRCTEYFITVKDIVLKQKIDDKNTYLSFNYEIHTSTANDIKHPELPDNFFLDLLSDHRSFPEIIKDLKNKKRNVLKDEFQIKNEILSKRNEIEEEETRLLKDNYTKVVNTFKNEVFGDYFHIKPVNLEKPVVIKSHSYIIFNENNRIVYNRQSM